MNRIRVALVGLGRMGRNHLKTILESRDFELVAVVDECKPNDVDLPKTSLFLKSVDELTSLDIDAAIVATPSETHYAVAAQLLAQKIHVLVEKPASSTSNEAKKLVSLAQEHSVTLAVGQVERCNPVVRSLKKILDSGLLGDPIHIETKRGGGFPLNVKPGNDVILDLAIHDLDLLRFLFGPLSVTHSAGHVTKLAGIFDTISIQLQTIYGSTASVHANWLSPQKVRSINIVGKTACCDVNYMAQECVLYGANLSPSAVETSLGPVEELDHPFAKSFRLKVPKGLPLSIQMDEWKSFILGGSSCLSSGDALIRSVELTEIALQLAQKSVHQPNTTVDRKSDTEAGLV
ncbi:MAG: Gfo/Idh/MocA family oxidoreductase [Pseudobacteriovorax sp.]|nr:Gfo/Idh/MocA family oxidoreductase [Pseudobacteriovorax sp.]